MLKRLKQSVTGWIHARPSTARQAGWHKWNPGNSVPLRDGSWSKIGRGQNWRRMTADGWEYEQDEDFEGDAEDLRGIDWD